MHPTVCWGGQWGEKEPQGKGVVWIWRAAVVAEGLHFLRVSEERQFGLCPEMCDGD